MKRLFGCIAAAAGLAAILPSALADSLRPGIIGTDDRVRVTEQGAPWEAVGQINIGGYRTAGQCTGTLVGPDIVITAAHCVMNEWRRKPHSLKDIHFLPGVRGPERKGHGTAKCLRFLPSYDFVWPETEEPSTQPRLVPVGAFYKDAVAIVLNEPLNVAPAPLADGAEPQPGRALVHAAYPADRRYVLSAHINCSLLRSSHEGPLWHVDCDTHPASSGGPVFVTHAGRLELAAILVGAGGGLSNAALPISAWRELVLSNACP
jgi:protease YdgD